MINHNEHLVFLWGSDYGLPLFAIQNKTTLICLLRFSLTSIFPHFNRVDLLFFFSWFWFLQLLHLKIYFLWNSRYPGSSLVFPQRKLSPSPSWIGILSVLILVLKFPILLSLLVRLWLLPWLFHTIITSLRKFPNKDKVAINLNF